MYIFVFQYVLKFAWPSNNFYYILLNYEGYLSYPNTAKILIIFAYVYIYMCVCMCVSVYIYIYIYMYIYKHIRGSLNNFHIFLYGHFYW